MKLHFATSLVFLAATSAFAGAISFSDDRGFQQVYFSPSESKVIFSNYDGQQFAANTKTGERVQIALPTCSNMLARNGGYSLLSTDHCGSTDSKLFLLNEETATVTSIASIPITSPNTITNAVLSTKFHRLAYAVDGEVTGPVVRVIDTSTGRSVGEFTNIGPNGNWDRYKVIRFSPDGSKLLVDVSAAVSAPAVIDINTGKVVSINRDSTYSNYSEIFFSPDSQQVVGRWPGYWLGSEPPKVKTFDAKTGKMTATFVIGTAPGGEFGACPRSS